MLKEPARAGAGFQYDPKEQFPGPTAPWVMLDRGVDPNSLFCCPTNIRIEHRDSGAAHE